MTKYTELKACRDAFEAWFMSDNSHRKDKPLQKNSVGDYLHVDVYHKWAAWQAAWNTRPAPSPDRQAALDAVKVEFREWLDCTGAFQSNCSWCFEVECFLDDAFKAALSQPTPPPVSADRQAALDDLLEMYAALNDSHAWKEKMDTVRAVLSVPEGTNSEVLSDIMKKHGFSFCDLSRAEEDAFDNAADEIALAFLTAPEPAEHPDFENDECFVYDPATGFFHTDDGGAPKHGIKWVNVATKPAPDLEGLREVFAGLKKANEFITNGIELGYIYIPEDELDSAYIEPQKVKQALEKLQAIIERNGGA